jgi:hypothetical protein
MRKKSRPNPKGRRPPSGKAARTYYEIEVSLLHIRPRIWRRFLLSQSATFQDLHEAIQDSFGWEYSHLWEFDEAGRERAPIAGPRRMEGVPIDFGVPMADARKLKLADGLSARSGPPRCLYVYDMGDYWEHDVKLRRELTEPSRFRRRLIAGARACPPEDCGGPPGYQDVVEFLRTGESLWHEDLDTMQEWWGDYDPEAFDLESMKAKFDR